MERRFKGSGNPRGRPKGSKNRKTIVKEVAGEVHSVEEDGKRKRLSILEMVLLRLRRAALEQKHRRALDEFHRLLKTYGPKSGNETGSYLVVPAIMTVEEAIAEGEQTNTITRTERAKKLSKRGPTTS